MTRSALVVGWALCAGAVAAPVAAQQAAEPIDRVVAVVGSAAITFTQLQEEFYTRYAVRGLEPPTEPARVQREMRELVDTLINAELLYQGALKDTTIVVSSLDVNDAVDQTMMRLRRQVPSEQAFLAELRRAGFVGIEDYRRWLVEDQHRELLRSQYLDNLRGKGEMSPVSPTEKEVRAYYESRKDALPPRPPSVNFRQIIIRPVPDSMARMTAFLTADSIARAIRDGADFAVAARRFSKDVASAQQGGEMDWFRRGLMVRPFEEAAFTLPRGTISNPVETVFGWHVIQVERRVPSEVKVRHILISPEIGQAELDRARAQAESLRQLIEAGASFDSLQAIHHDPSELREGLGAIVDSLHPSYASGIAGVPAGGISPVFEVVMEGSSLPPKYAIVKVTERIPAGPQPYDQIRERARIALGEVMGQQRYFDELRRKVYIDIRFP